MKGRWAVVARRETEVLRWMQVSFGASAWTTSRSC